jgi:hypothetical protein
MAMKKPAKVRDIPGMEHHPRSPNASPEALERLIGVISLTGPVPSWKFMEEDEDRCESDTHARD